MMMFLFKFCPHSVLSCYLLPASRSLPLVVLGADVFLCFPLVITQQRSSSAEPPELLSVWGSVEESAQFALCDFR